MATAGARYEERTGNIWSYANRGDITGIKAALVRGVNVNMTNTVGWTACHAAAAGGQTKAIRLLVKSAADLSIVDKGGNSPAHQAAKNGHVHALRVLQELGADISKVRLSQAKGKAVRDTLIQSYRNAGKSENEEEVSGEREEDSTVGYARKQSKSTAFWGPRRTPISGKIKKKILKDKRKSRKEKKTISEEKERDSINHENINEKEGTMIQSLPEGVEDLSYQETVKQVRRIQKQKQRQKQGRRKAPSTLREEKIHENEEKEDYINDVYSEDLSKNINDDNDEEFYENSHSTNTDRFSVLALLDDSESDSELSE
jgi:hypothetical protein